MIVFRSDGSELHHLLGDEHLLETFYGGDLTFRVSPLAFFQGTACKCFPSALKVTQHTFVYYTTYFFAKPSSN